MYRTMALLISLAVLSSCSPIDNRRTNKAIARNYIEMLENRDKTGRWEHFFAESITFNENKMSRQALMSLAEEMFSQYTDLQVTIEDQVAEGDTVVTRVIFEGTKLHDVTGIPPSRKKVRFMAIAIDRFKGDKVIEMWHTTEDLDIR